METFFLKSHELFLKEDLLYQKLEAFDNGEMQLSEGEVEEIERQIDKIFDENYVSEFGSVFTVNKMTDEYTTLTSEEECIDFINVSGDLIDFGSFVFEGKVFDKQQSKDFCLYKLSEFWKKYPNGVIAII